MMFLKISQNSQESTCVRVFFLKKKETLAQVFSCEFYEIFKNTFFYSGGCFCPLPKDKMTLEIRREFFSKIVFMKMKIKQI